MNDSLVVHNRQLARRARDYRLGSVFTEVPVYRTGRGSNVVSIGLGKDADDIQSFNLTLSTCVNHLLLATSKCSDCLEDSDGYDPTQSGTLASLGQELLYTYASPSPPTGSSLMNISGEVVSETMLGLRSGEDTTNIILVNSFRDAVGDAIEDEYGRNQGFAGESSGYLGLGIDRNTPSYSVPHQLRDVNGSLTIGLDIRPMTSDIETSRTAGSMHWGAVPEGSWRGDWSWVEPVGSIASVWSLKMDKFKVNGRDISRPNLRMTVDPGIYTIMAPESLAWAIYDRVGNAKRDVGVTNRWSIPCTTNFSLSVHLSDGAGAYHIDDSQLVQPKDARSCWGGVVAWPKGSAMDIRGQVVVGTPFLASIYTTLYLDNSTRYVGLAVKADAPQNVMDFAGSRLSGGAIAGIIVAVILVVLAILLCLFSRSRDSMAGFYNRAMRRQAKMARVQVMTQYPGIHPPTMPLPPAGVMSEPRHMDELYSKPWYPDARGMGQRLALAGNPGSVPVLLPGAQGPLISPREIDDGAPKRTRGGSLSGGGFFGGWRRARQSYKEEQQQRQDYMHDRADAEAKERSRNRRHERYKRRQRRRRRSSGSSDSRRHGRRNSSESPQLDLIDPYPPLDVLNQQAPHFSTDPAAFHHHQGPSGMGYQGVPTSAVPLGYPGDPGYPSTQKELPGPGEFGQLPRTTRHMMHPSDEPLVQHAYPLHQHDDGFDSDRRPGASNGYEQGYDMQPSRSTRGGLMDRFRLFSR